MFNLCKWFNRKKDHIVDEGLNVVTGISKARTIYKELILQSHPDKHPGEEEYYKEITNRINANRYNYKELLKIQKELLSVISTKRENTK